MENYDKYQAAVINGIKEHVAIMTSVQGLYRELKAGQTREDLVKSAVAGMNMNKRVLPPSAIKLSIAMKKYTMKK